MLEILANFLKESLFPSIERGAFYSGRLRANIRNVFTLITQLMVMFEAQSCQEEVFIRVYLLG